MRVVRGSLAGSTGQAEEDFFASARLVCRDDMLESAQLPGALLEPEKAPGARVRFVPFHHPRPLLRAHGGRAAVGQQVDQDIFSPNQERVKARQAENLLAL